MEKFAICEVIQDYEPIFDDKENCFRDMNNTEIKIKYGKNPFICCGIEYNNSKRSQFVNQHCKSLKHKKKIDIINDNFKKEFGNYNTPGEFIVILQKENRDLKKQLYNKNEESKYKDNEIAKLNSRNEILQKENISLKLQKGNISLKLEKGKKKLTIANQFNLD